MKAVVEAQHCGSITLCFHKCWSHSPFGTPISIWCFRRPLGPPSPESPQFAIYVRKPWHVSLASWTWKLKIPWIDSSTKCSQFILTTHLISPGHTAPSITGTHKPLQHNKRGFDPYKWILTVTFFSGDTIMNHFNQPGSHRIHPGTAPWNIQAWPGKRFRAVRSIQEYLNSFEVTESLDVARNRSILTQEPTGPQVHTLDYLQWSSKTTLS